MWLDLVIDVLMPTGRSRSAERPDKNGKTIPVEVQVPGAFKRSLNESGELDEAIAAGDRAVVSAKTLCSGAVTAASPSPSLRTAPTVASRPLPSPFQSSSWNGVSGGSPSMRYETFVGEAELSEAPSLSSPITVSCPFGPA